MIEDKIYIKALGELCKEYSENKIDESHFRYGLREIVRNWRNVYQSNNNIQQREERTNNS